MFLINLSLPVNLAVQIPGGAYEKVASDLGSGGVFLRVPGFLHHLQLTSHD